LLIYRSQGVFLLVLDFPLFVSISLAVIPAQDSALRSYHVSVAKAESLWVTQMGEGQPVVLIPGLFGAAYGFRRVLPLLAAQGFRAIVIEPLGIGFSARPEKADYSLNAQADRIAMVLDRLDIRGAILVPHQIGASMVFRLAYRRPELVRAIVSLEGGAAEAMISTRGRAAIRFIPWVKWFGGVKVIRKKIRSDLVESSADTAWVTDAVVDGYTAGAAANIDATLKALWAMAAAREREKLGRHLTEIRVPVLLLVAKASNGTGAPRKEIELLRRSLASFEVDTVANSGCYIHEEAPEAVVRAVQRMVLSPSAASR
jgi:pimeloyl-ACP methyl ester carboxylesterase